jgi:hypothetical protein
MMITDSDDIYVYIAPAGCCKFPPTHEFVRHDITPKRFSQVQKDWKFQHALQPLINLLVDILLLQANFSATKLLMCS